MRPDPEDLLEHLFEHLCEEQAALVAELPDEEIRRRAEIGIARAQSHGFEEAEAITAYVTLMFVVAPDFDQQASIAKALEPTGEASADRLRKLFSKTSEADWDRAAGNTRGWEHLE